MAGVSLCSSSNVSRRFDILTFPGGPFAAIAAEWRLAETLGFDGAFLVDTLAKPGFVDYEAWVTLAALARETSRIRIGTLVTVLPLRHPAVLAAQASSVDRISEGRLGIPARWSRTQSSAKILSMKRSSRVSFVSQCTTSLSETGSILGGAFISCSRTVTLIDGTGYVVSPLDGVNGVRRNLLARIGLSVGCRVSGTGGRRRSAALPFNP